MLLNGWAMDQGTWASFIVNKIDCRSLPLINCFILFQMKGLSGFPMFISLVR